MGDEVRVTAREAITSLCSRVVMTASLETALNKARITTAILANKLDQRVTLPSKEKADALIALDMLITRLQEAKPNEPAEGL